MPTMHMTSRKPSNNWRPRVNSQTQTRALSTARSHKHTAKIRVVASSQSGAPKYRKIANMVCLKAKIALNVEELNLDMVIVKC